MKPYILILNLLVLASCGNDPKSEISETRKSPDSVSLEQTVTFNTEQLKSVGIDVGTPHLENISGVLNLQGKIDVPPQSTVSLSFPLGGYLKSTKMLPGMQVRKGQILAELEDMQFIQLQQDYLDTKAKLEFADLEFARQQELSRDNVNALNC